MRDIVTLNFLVTICVLFLFVVGFYSLASIFFLVYSSYSAYICITLVTKHEIATLNLDIIPDIEEKYIMQKAALKYIHNALRGKHAFIAYDEIRNTIR